jgi:SNF2 family DNA or RNA helicase
MAKLVLPKHLNDLEAEELIWGPPDDMLFEEDMRRYQNWMSDLICGSGVHLDIDEVLEEAGVYLGADMGLGKTGSVLHAFVRLLREGRVKHGLIVAPLYVAEETWTEEIAKWAFARDLRYRVVTGTEPERIAALKLGPGDLTIVNRENLRWLLRKLGLKRWCFDFIVYDEASRLKRGMTRTRKNQRKDGTESKPRLSELGVLDAVRFKTKKLVELSGTPAPNGLIDLYGPVYAIDRGKRLGNSMTAYKRRWFIEDKYTNKVEPREGALEDITRALKGVFYSLRSEDYLDLPPLIHVDRKVTLNPRERSQYRELERESALEVMGRWGDPEWIEAVNGGVLVGKLLQYANGSLYGEDGVDHPVHTKKLDALESIVEESGGKPLLVAYSFKFDKDAILKRFPQARVFGEGENDKRHWNAGRIPMMLMHPASAGHGLNFQKGSNIAVWYGLTWSLELYLQFIKRLWRPGQTESRVFLYRILAQGTADFDVLRALQTKGATQDSITDTVRVRLEKMAA